jgi:ligand-binding sensor domain-containing protein
MLAFSKLLSLVLLLQLSTACVNKKGVNHGPSASNTMLNETANGLTFTSGIRSIIQDSKGNYWIGSDQEGLCKFDGKSCTYFNTTDGLCGQQVISIKEDETGLIWISTSSGLCAYDGAKFIPASQLQVSNTIIDQQRFFSQKGLWFPAAKADEIICVEQGKVYKVKNPIQIPLNKNPVDYGITGFTHCRNGGIWIAYYSGLTFFDGQTSIHYNDSSMHFDGNTNYMHVRCILEDSKGRLWVGNNSIGVLLKEKDTWVNFSERFNVLKNNTFGAPVQPGTLMHVFAIQEDSQGNIWFGDRDTGAWRFDGTTLKNFIVDDTLQSQHIWNIYEDHHGNLLFAMAEKGVYKFNGHGFDKFL